MIAAFLPEEGDADFVPNRRFDQATRILELEALLSRVAEHLPYHERSHPDWTPLSDLGREVRATLRGETDAPE